MREEISPQDIEILQEVINIAFGKATSGLAELIDLHLELSVPFIRVENLESLPGYMRSEMEEHGSVCIIEQNYWGRFNGAAYLVIPSASSKTLVRLVNRGEACEGEDMDGLETETLKEVGNIIIGACISKIAELLSDIVTYSPPLVFVDKKPDEIAGGDIRNPESRAILMRTVFGVDGKGMEISGFLFLVAAAESMAWLKHALNRFMEQYSV